MRTLNQIMMAIAIAHFFALPAESQTPIRPAYYTYADLADLALPASVVALAQISRATRLKSKDAIGVPAGKTRFYVEANILLLVKGPQASPSTVSYLLDLPNEAASKAPKLNKKSQHLLFAQSVPQRPGELQLIAPDAHLPSSADIVARTRQILTEAGRPDSAPKIKGISSAFYEPGSLPGESETQIFLQTANDRPVSLNIIRRPGEQPRWAVALSEIVDDAAAPPAPNSLLWYRLACALPVKLPAQSLADIDSAQSQAIESDYRLVLVSLGPCIRNRPRL